MPKFVIDSSEAELPHVVRLLAYNGNVEIKVDGYTIAIITTEGKLKLVDFVSSSTGLKIVAGKVVVIS